MLVGEIGYDRREFLYELQLWEILLIVHGYFRRHHPGWEQARLVAYCAKTAMGCSGTPPDIDAWLPFAWERERLKVKEPTADDVAELRALIQSENQRLEEERNQKENNVNNGNTENTD